MTINADGQLAIIEVDGPSTICSMGPCLPGVYCGGAVMFGATTLFTLDAHCDLIALCARRYGPEAWVMLHRADIRARLEQW